MRVIICTFTQNRWLHPLEEPERQTLRAKYPVPIKAFSDILTDIPAEVREIVLETDENEVIHVKDQPTNNFNFADCRKTGCSSEARCFLAILETPGIEIIQPQDLLTAVNGPSLETQIIRLCANCIFWLPMPTRWI